MPCARTFSIMLQAWIKKHIILLLVLLPMCLVAQDGYHYPMDVPMYLSGTFGEPRGSHFHSGIDIRTGGREGLDVFAIEDGTVSRIKVSATGYGNALYIDHPDGCTSVYAHLQRFSPRIDSFIKAIHYRKEEFELDEYLKAGELTVKRGEIIALSGNSGGSGGPHLHFEIRDTKSQIPVNPQLYRFKVSDKIAPGIHGLFVYPKTDSLLRSDKLKVYEAKGNHYYTSAETLWVNTQTIGLGLHSTDKMNNSSSSNGIYSLKMQVDGKTVYSFSMDRFAFSETKYVKCHMDYAEKVATNSSVYRCYKLPGNTFERVYDSIVADGYFKLSEKPVKVTFEVKDFQGNMATLSTFLGYKTDSKVLPKRTDMDLPLVRYGEEKSLTKPGIDLRFPPATFYNDVYFNYEQGPHIGIGELSPLHHVHEFTEPVKNRYTITLEPDTILFPEKMLIARLDEDNDMETYTSSWKGLKLSANPRETGIFFVTLDTVAPTIKPINISDGKSLSGEKTIRFTIEDKVSGIKSYRGEVDGQWILFQYDKKNDLLYYEFDGRIAAGEHNLQLTVIDEVGNVQTYSCTFKK